jgi:hypothetical protein
VTRVARVERERCGRTRSAHGVMRVLVLALGLVLAGVAGADEADDEDLLDSPHRTEGIPERIQTLDRELSHGVGAKPSEETDAEPEPRDADQPGEDAVVPEEGDEAHPAKTRSGVPADAEASPKRAHPGALSPPLGNKPLGNKPLGNQTMPAPDSTADDKPAAKPRPATSEGE